MILINVSDDGAERCICKSKQQEKNSKNDNLSHCMLMIVLILLR